jgi:D-alanyl-lipoteichoic acid acyltransferase DltB (MBOAT superfamily)
VVRHGLREHDRQSNFGTVFTFVALWHDISLNLLIWGWLIVFFMMPEVIAGWLFPRRRWENNLTAYRVLCGVGVVGNLMMMMIANLVGFAVGVDGLKSIIAGIFKDYSGMSILLGESCRMEKLTELQVLFSLSQHRRRCLWAFRSCLRFEKAR